MANHQCGGNAFPIEPVFSDPPLPLIIANCAIRIEIQTIITSQSGFAFDGSDERLSHAMQPIHRIDVKAREPRRNRMAWFKFFGD